MSLELKKMLVSAVKRNNYTDNYIAILLNEKIRMPVSNTGEWRGRK